MRKYRFRLFFLLGFLLYHWLMLLTMRPLTNNGECWSEVIAHKLSNPMSIQQTPRLLDFGGVRTSYCTSITNPKVLGVTTTCLNLRSLLIEKHLFVGTISVKSFPL